MPNPENLVLRRYTFRLYPKSDQAQALHDLRRMIPDLWNGLLARHEEIWRRTYAQRGVTHRDDQKRYLTYFDMTGDIKPLRDQCPEWKALSVWTAYCVAKSLADALQAFLKGQRGYPRFRRRDSGTRIPFRHARLFGQKTGGGSGCHLTHRNGRNWSLLVKGVHGAIHARGILPLPAMSYKNADIVWRDNKWWFSVCCELPARRYDRERGDCLISIKFDCVDGLAYVNGVLETPQKLDHAQALSEHCDSLKSERDRRWPKPARDDPDWQYANREISHLLARVKRIRHDALHVWTARIVAHAGAITIIAPPVKDFTRSPKGTSASPGVNVEAVSELNRRILSFAPASAIQMLKYKAEETGIECEVVEDHNPNLAIGQELIEAGKELRRAQRAQRRAA